MLSFHGLATLAGYRSGDFDRGLVCAAARDAREPRAMGMPWTSALARVLAAAGMSVHAAMARRRLGELDGGAAGARAGGEADAWLAAQGIRAPERLARLYMPEVAWPHP